jgi:hypothetical protein
MALALRKHESPPAELSSRLLPRLLGEESPLAGDHSRILDFGRAHPLSLAFYSETSCRLQILDASDTLRTGLAPAGPGDDGGEAPAIGTEDFSRLFPELTDQHFDLILLWDTLNLLPSRALQGFFAFLGRHAAPGFIGHGFMLHKQNVASELRHFGVCDAGTVRIVRREALPLFLHTRKAVNEAMLPLSIGQAVLHSDGRSEFLFASPPGR